MRSRLADLKSEVAAIPQRQLEDGFFAFDLAEHRMYDLTFLEIDTTLTITVLEMENSALSVSQDELHSFGEVELGE